jgi:rhamnosyltransferase subunit B
MVEQDTKAGRTAMERKKVILTAIGTAGDVFPSIGVGVALKERGHDVWVVVNPHFRKSIEDAGLGFLPFGTEQDYLRVTEDPDIWHPERGFGAIMRWLVPHVGQLYETVVREAESGRTIIVAHALDFGTRMAQEKHGLPVVSMVLSPSLFRSVHQMPVLQGTRDWSSWPRWSKALMWWIADRRVIDPAMLAPLNDIRQSLNLPPIRRPLNGWIFSPLLTIGMFPAWFAPPQPDWPAQLRLTGFPLFDAAEPVPAEVEGFLASGPPPIVFTPGTGVKDPRAFFDAAIEACQRLSQRGLLLTRLGGPLPDLPPEFCHAPFAPLSRVLTRSSALVHHGGIGSTSAALAAGVPQVIRPMSHDQPDNAARVVRLGVGERLLPDEFGAASLAAKLGGLLDKPGVAHRCAALAGRIRASDPIGATCDLIEAVPTHSN